MPTTASALLHQLNQHQAHSHFGKRVDNQAFTASLNAEPLNDTYNREGSKTRQQRDFSHATSSLRGRPSYQQRSPSNASEDRRLQTTGISNGKRIMRAFPQPPQQNAEHGGYGCGRDPLSSKSPANACADQRVSPPPCRIVYRRKNANPATQTRGSSSGSVVANGGRHPQESVEFHTTPSAVQRHQNWQLSRSSSFNSNLVTSQCMNDEELGRFRTQICPKKAAGVCLLEERCSFSHCLSFHRRPPHLTGYRPHLCPNVIFSIGSNRKMRVKNFCKRGRLCLFSHTKEEQMYHPKIYKTMQCRDWPGCTKQFCPFAHGPGELRNPDLIKFDLVAGPEKPELETMTRRQWSTNSAVTTSNKSYDNNRSDDETPKLSDTRTDTRRRIQKDNEEEGSHGHTQRNWLRTEKSGWLRTEGGDEGQYDWSNRNTEDTEVLMTRDADGSDDGCDGFAALIDHRNGPDQQSGVPNQSVSAPSMLQLPGTLACPSRRHYSSAIPIESHQPFLTVLEHEKANDRWMRHEDNGFSKLEPLQLAQAQTDKELADQSNQALINNRRHQQPQSTGTPSTTDEVSQLLEIVEDQQSYPKYKKLDKGLKSNDNTLTISQQRPIVMQTSSALCDEFVRQQQQLNVPAPDIRDLIILEILMASNQPSSHQTRCCQATQPDCPVENTLMDDTTPVRATTVRRLADGEGRGEETNGDELQSIIEHLQAIQKQRSNRCENQHRTTFSHSDRPSYSCHRECDRRRHLPDAAHGYAFDDAFREQQATMVNDLSTTTQDYNYSTQRRSIPPFPLYQCVHGQEDDPRQTMVRRDYTCPNRMPLMHVMEAGIDQEDNQSIRESLPELRREEMMLQQDDEDADDSLLQLHHGNEDGNQKLHYDDENQFCFLLASMSSMTLVTECPSSGSTDEFVSPELNSYYGNQLDVDSTNHR